MERKKYKNNKGAIILESLIVYPITVILLFFILAIFSVLHQRWNLQTIANEAAMRMAQTYRLSQADEESGFVDITQLTSVGPYRYVANVFNHNMEETINERVKDYAGWRLSKTTYTKSVSEPDITVEAITDSLGRRHIVVRIVGEYSVPFGEALSYFGFDSTITYETTAYAECVDIIDYINLVDYVDAQTSLKQFGSKTIGLIDAVLSLFDNIFDE